LKRILNVVFDFKISGAVHSQSLKIKNNYKKENIFCIRSVQPHKPLE